MNKEVLRLHTLNILSIVGRKIKEIDIQIDFVELLEIVDEIKTWLSILSGLHNTWKKNNG